MGGKSIFKLKREARGTRYQAIKELRSAPAYAKRLRLVNPPAAGRGCGKPTLDGNLGFTH